jgi:hypothetical protein
MPKGKKVNKMDAVRQVLTKHGEDTMPVQIVKFVRVEHGADMSTDMASTYKSAILRKAGQGSQRKGKKPGLKRVGATPRTNGHYISIDDIQAVKKLVDSMGAAKVRQLAHVLAK